MLKFKSRLIAAAALALTCLANAPAMAHVTYVSGKGTDAGNCSSPANPCRTFQFAINQTVAGGEVKALDPADYSPVTITKSISITGVEGAGIDTNGINGIGIKINAAGSTVSIANLLIQSVSGLGSDGIAVFPNSTHVTITHCTVRGFGTGISLIGPATFFLIADTVVTNNGDGISAETLSGGTLDHVVAYGNSRGVAAVKSVITAVDTIANNNGTGFSVANLPGITSLFLARSTAIGNSVGVSVGSAPGTSFGDNHIKGNGTDVQGTLTNIGTQ
jgi:hypothetical protein